MPVSSISRQIGSIFMIVGTEVGAGILALPIIISHFGILFGSFVLVAAWALTLYTALLVCEANSTLGDGVSFASMAGKYLGKWGKLFLALIFWITLSAIVMAYISAAGSTFNSVFDLSVNITSIIFVFIFGICVLTGTQVVDYANRLLLSIKLGAFILAIILLFTTLKIDNLFVSTHLDNVLFSVPAIITAFILHNIIPTIRTYLNNNQQMLRRVVIIGSIIPLVLYIIWVIAIMGNIPLHGMNSFDALYSKGAEANIGDLLTILSKDESSSLIAIAINFAAIISLTTSFLCTSISLYHFIQDFFLAQRDNNRAINRAIYNFFPVIFTFFAPLLIVMLYPNIFVMALSYAGAGATILFVLLPIIIIKQMIKQGHVFSLNIFKNAFFLNLSFIIGIGVVLIQIFSVQ
jgi:tyrosine-specific transport protein